MKNFFAFLTLIFAAVSVHAQSADVATGPTAFIYANREAAPKGKGLKAEGIPLNGLMMPESVVARKGMLYVANVGGEPMKSPKMGFIMVSGLKGENAKTLFKGQLDDPKGFGFLSDDLILISDHPSVKVLDLKAEKVVAELKLDAPGFLNDVVVLDAKTALLSDTGKGTVHLITFDGKTLKAMPVKGLDGTVGGVNGMYYANNKLYLVTSTFGGNAKAGDIYTFTFTKGWMEGTLSKPWIGKQIGAGGLDGIYVKGDNVLISDWGKGKNNSSFFIFSETSKKRVLASGGRNSIADFGVSEDGWIYFPEMNQNNVIKIHYPL